MSEKIYALLLRLFPVRFRKVYAEEALQLFRDRSRDEKGFFPGLRLWFDLLADLAVSIPREYRHAEPSLVGASALHPMDGIPEFQLLETESPRPGTLFSGTILSLATFAAVSILIVHGGSSRPAPFWNSQAGHPNSARSTTSRTSSRQRSGNDQEKIMTPDGPTRDISSIETGDVQAGSVQSKHASAPDKAGLDQSSLVHAERPKPIDAAERKRVIDAAASNLKQYYFDRDVAQKAAEALKAHEASGDENAATDGEALAALLTGQMREVSHDTHLVMEYSRATLREHRSEPTAGELARYRTTLKDNNCFFEKVETLPHNIGYLKLNSFPDISECHATATASMAALNHADAIIFDLRDNTGGSPSMVSLIASYLFDHPEYMFNPRETPSQNSWTRSPVPGNRLADKPVYVLTSGSTWSGAEQFSYDLKMLKRATLVGETTRGGAHAGVFHRIDDHFGMGIPEAKIVNPFGNADWEGTGVEPDVKVKAGDALATAERLAANKLTRK